MAVNVVTTSNLGSEFDLGAIETGKVHLKLDSTLVRDVLTGEIGVDPASLTIANDLQLLGTVLQSTVNGATDSVDLGPVIDAAETVTVLVAGATAVAALSYTDEDAAVSVIDLTAAIKDGETLTVLGYNPLTKTLTYNDEAAGVTAVDLSALAADIYISGATFNPASLVLTLTDVDGVTPDVTVDLSQLRVTSTDNADGTYTLAQAGSSMIIDTRDGVSVDAGNLLSVGADLLPFVDAGDVRALADTEVQDAFGAVLYYAFSTNV